MLVITKRFSFVSCFSSARPMFTFLHWLAFGFSIASTLAYLLFLLVFESSMSFYQVIEPSQIYNEDLIYGWNSLTDVMNTEAGEWFSRHRKWRHFCKVKVGWFENEFNFKEADFGFSLHYFSKTYFFNHTLFTLTLVNLRSFKKIHHWVLFSGHLIKHNVRHGCC